MSDRYTATNSTWAAIDLLAPDADPEGAPWFGSRIYKTDPAKLRELLILAACPCVCRGYLDGGENWHELCIAKADKALAALEVHDA